MLHVSMLVAFPSCSVHIYIHLYVYIYRGIMYHECVHLLCALCCTPDVVEHILVAAVLRVREHHLACGQWNI